MADEVWDRGDRVHALSFGFAVCQDPPGLPHTWPKSNKWVRPDKFASVPVGHQCPRCKTKMAIDSDRLIKSAARGRESLRMKNPCPVAGCVRLGKHFGDHEKADGTKFSGDSR